MKKVRIALVAFTFAAAIGGAFATKAVAGPSDDCNNLPSGAICNASINETCCSYFVQGQRVDGEKGRLQQ